jgi:hypothetical protein
MNQYEVSFHSFFWAAWFQQSDICPLFPLSSSRFSNQSQQQQQQQQQQQNGLEYQRRHLALCIQIIKID